MDVNAAINKAVEEKMEQIKGQIIKQTLEEDHDYIMFKLHKIFGASYKHIENVLKKYNGDYATENEEVLNILAKMMDDVEEAVTGKKVEKTCDCDGKCENCTCNKTEEDDEPNRIALEEIPVDKQKRITISYNTLYEAGLDAENRLFVLKSKEDEDVFYIVNEFFNWDENHLDLAKIVYNNENTAVRIGIGKLLDVKYGDIVGVDVYDRQLVIYTTGSNVEDLTENEVEEEPEEEQVTNPFNKKEFSLNDLLKEVQERVAKDKDKFQPWFIRHYKIEI